MSDTVNRFVLLHEQDNILVCCVDTSANTPIEIDGKVVSLPQAIEVGHKIARTALSKNDKVFKYGAPIGSAACTIAIAEHVHTHNLKSDYIPSHSRAGKFQFGEEQSS